MAQDDFPDIIQSKRFLLELITKLSAISLLPAISACSATHVTTETGSEEITLMNRYERGLQHLKRIDGEAGEKVIAALQPISPDLARYVIEYPFGDVYNREQLDFKTREIITVSVLAALGNAVPQLKVHLHGALNVGCSSAELTELMIQLSVYAGFPAALNGTFALKEVLQERGEL